MSNISIFSKGLPHITVPFWLFCSKYGQRNTVYSMAIDAWRHIKTQTHDLAGTPWTSEHASQVPLMSSHIAVQELYDSKTEKLSYCDVLGWQHNVMIVAPLLDLCSTCNKYHYLTIPYFLILPKYIASNEWLLVEHEPEIMWEEALMA